MALPEARTGLTASVADLATLGAGILLVARRAASRGTFCVALVERLCERAGAHVRPADGTGNGDGPEAALLRSVIDAFAAYERALIRSRTKTALAVKKARGERVGGVPYGFRVGTDGRLVEVPAEQAVAALTRRLRGEGRSLRQIAAALVAKGHRPRNGGAWAVRPSPGSAGDSAPPPTGGLAEQHLRLGSAALHGAVRGAPTDRTAGTRRWRAGDGSVRDPVRTRGRMSIDCRSRTRSPAASAYRVRGGGDGQKESPAWIGTRDRGLPERSRPPGRGRGDRACPSGARSSWRARRRWRACTT